MTTAGEVLEDFGFGFVWRETTSNAHVDIVKK
jgi:hypothetical protein